MDRSFPPGSKKKGGAGSGDTPGNRELEDESVTDRRLRGSNEDLPCSRLPLQIFRDDSEQRSFQEVTDPPAANQIPNGGLYGPDNSFKSETAFGVLDEQDGEQGPLLDFGFLGASCDLQDIMVAVPAGDEGTVLHLCRSKGTGGRPDDQAGIVHSDQGETCAAARLDRPWTTADVPRRATRGPPGRDRPRPGLAEAPLPPPGATSVPDDQLEREKARRSTDRDATRRTLGSEASSAGRDRKRWRSGQKRIRVVIRSDDRLNKTAGRAAPLGESTLSPDDRRSPRSKSGRRGKRKKKAKRRRSTTDSSSSSSTSVEDEQLFQDAGGGKGLATRLERVTRRHPG